MFLHLPRSSVMPFCRAFVVVFPMVAVTNDHKMGGLKQPKFILLQFRRPEVQNSYHQAKIKVSRGLQYFQRLQGRICSLSLAVSNLKLPAVLNLWLHHEDLCLHGHSAFSSV